jgi:hypothetical protein
MILETLPQVKEFSAEQKWQLIDELWADLVGNSAVPDAESTKEIVELLEARYQLYLAHPETASSAAEVSERMRALKGK